MRGREREGRRARVDSEQNHVTTPSGLIGYFHTHVGICAAIATNTSILDQTSFPIVSSKKKRSEVILKIYKN